MPTNWVTLTWKQTSDIVDQLAAGLLSRGLGYEERVAICSNTRIEWILVDLAIAAAAATLLSMAACGSSNAASGKSDSSGAASSGKIEVVASINQWGSVAEDLGGDGGTVGYIKYGVHCGLLWGASGE